MIVKQLIEQLQELDPDMAVYLSGDEEGNYFRPVVEVESSFFDREECEAIHPDDAKEYDEIPDKAVILWP